LEGPGAPIETSSSATLPERSFLAYLKLDHVSFEKKTDARDDEGDTNAYWMYGLGYGIRSYLSAYLFVPYYAKKTEDNSYNTAGFADLSLMTVVGFRIDDTIRLVPANESLDDLEDLHFTLYGGLTLPTGDADLRNADGAIDPGMSLGFGKPSVMIGLTATKQIETRFTGSLDGSMIRFQEREYEDGARVRFGTELRLNGSLGARLLTDTGRGIRLDANLEGNFLDLGRDETDGAGEEATGGRMIYALAGLRLYAKSSSLGVGIKRPVWTDLNEEPLQQGAEGKEDLRLVVTFSTLL
ncbi:MAG: transporter, partial [Candidatus Latescibacteria bacterium]|nr:transporter [Candidatus Latescibacterota bacterium]